MATQTIALVPNVPRAASTHPDEPIVSMTCSPRPLTQPTIKSAANHSLRGMEFKSPRNWARKDDGDRCPERLRTRMGSAPGRRDTGANQKKTDLGLRSSGNYLPDSLRRLATRYAAAMTKAAGMMPAPSKGPGAAFIPPVPYSAYSP